MTIGPLTLSDPQLHWIGWTLAALLAAQLAERIYRDVVRRRRRAQAEARRREREAHWVRKSQLNSALNRERQLSDQGRRRKVNSALSRQQQLNSALNQLSYWGLAKRGDDGVWRISDPGAAEHLATWRGWGPDERSDPDRPGHLYFVQAGDGGPIKIGWSNDPARRLQGLETSSPYPLSLLATCPGTQREESALHARFWDYHLRGEWFSPGPELLEHIRTLTGGEPMAGD